MAVMRRYGLIEDHKSLKLTLLETRLNQKQRRKARPFSVMVSKKDAEALPEYPVHADTISPDLALAVRLQDAIFDPAFQKGPFSDMI
jgi:uncharacterized protein with von Willebrand factor type A (vWA) domain